jgi:hypothetical protein
MESLIKCVRTLVFMHGGHEPEEGGRIQNDSVVGIELQWLARGENRIDKYIAHGRRIKGLGGWSEKVRNPGKGVRGVLGRWDKVDFESHSK